MTAKKTKKPRRRQAYRNAARAKPSQPASSNEPTDTPTGTADDRALDTLKVAGGGLLGALACAIAARLDLARPEIVTGTAALLSLGLAVQDKYKGLRTVGAGALAGTGGQLALLLVDDLQRPPNKDGAPAVASASPPPKKPSNAEGLPPGALEAAYERARRRMALSHEYDQAG
jgi:hypothetical protein